MPSDRLQTALWLGFGLLLLWLVYLLTPILTPFVLAGILAYVCNPLVERLEGLELPRTLAVVIVIVALGLLVAGLLVVLVPLLQDEVILLVQRIPDAIALLNEHVTPWLREHGIRLQLDAASLRKLVNSHLADLQGVGTQLFSSLRIGGRALLGIVTTLMLTPVVLFYLMMDWHKLLARIDSAIPRPWHAKTVAIVRDIDAVLSQFLRGQLLVMLVLAIYYGGILSLAGLPSALPVGILTGLLIFIPYIGFGLGFLLALLTALLQFQGFGPILTVLIVYGIGQILESFLLTPYLVGDRIGLHPLAVIFALLAFAELFGFIGVLLALPVSAAMLVGLREVRTLYLDSRFYRGRNPRHDDLE